MEENALKNPANQVERRADGTLLPGSVLSPNGPHGNSDVVWQPYGQRCRYWLNKLTRGEIKKLAQDESELDKLSSYDAIIIAHMARTMAGKEMSRERAQLLAYIEGMPVQTVQTIDLKKPSEKDINETTDEEALAEYERLTKK